LVESLKEKLKEAETARQEFIKNGGTPGESLKKTKVITKIIVGSQNHGKRKKDRPTETHKDGERVRYFPDDDKHSLKSMVCIIYHTYLFSKMMFQSFILLR